MDNDQAAQAEEIESLQSIYFPEELKISKYCQDIWRITVFVPIEVPDNYKVRYASKVKDEGHSYLNVRHLPPIRLQVLFTKNYPSQFPPKYFLVCQWLNDNALTKLRRHLIKLWKQNAGFPIVYTWVEYLKCNALAVVDMNEILDLTLLTELHTNDENRPCTSNGHARGRSARVNAMPQRSVVEIIEAYDKEQEVQTFLKSYHPCQICFTEKLGRDSMLFEPCCHIFCRECLKSYFTVLINEGSSCAVKCPGYKCDTEASQTQVRELLPLELFEKYDRALLSTMLDTMSDIVYCPRSTCQYPVTCKPEDEMAICPYCKYAFCIYCRRVYHGVETCRFNPDERKKIVESYQNASLEEKQQMEIRYGKKQIEVLVSNSLSEDWIKDNSKNCPSCNVVIEKSDGCNKMTCFRCQTFFCWLCGAHLDINSPYSHYQDPTSPCNNKLFQYVPMDYDEIRMEWDDWADLVYQDSGSEDMEGEDTDTDSDVGPLL